MAETLRRDGSSGQARIWVVVVLAYVILLSVCLATISYVAESWTARASLILAIVALYNIAFSLTSSTLGALSKEFPDDMTSPNLRDYLASNFYALSVAFNVAATGFQTVLYGGAEAGSSGQETRKRPRFALLTSFGAALVVVAYSVVHLFVICPLTYLFYLPGSHFLNVVLASPTAHRSLMRATDGEAAADSSTLGGTSGRQQGVLDVVETLRQKQSDFRKLFATALAGFGSLALQIMS